MRTLNRKELLEELKEQLEHMEGVRLAACAATIRLWDVRLVSATFVTKTGVDERYEVKGPEDYADDED